MPTDRGRGRPAKDLQIEQLKQRLIGAPIWGMFSAPECDIWLQAAVKYFEAQLAAGLDLESAYLRAHAMIAAGNTNNK